MDGGSIPLVLAQQPVNSGELTIQFVVLLVALTICGLASAAETALTSVSRIRIRNLAEDGNEGAQRIDRLLTQPGTFLSTILVMNSVAVILATALATSIALAISTQWGEVISTVLVSFFVLVFCEVTPKNAALQNPEKMALRLIGLVSVAAWVLRPVNALLSTITTGIARLFGFPQRRVGPSVTEEELKLLVNVGEEEGVVEKDERSMIHRIFGLGDTTVREVMVPRIDMVTLEADVTIAEAVDLITQGGQSRIPVYDDTIDNILGVLYAKDLLRELRANHADIKIRDLLRSAYFVPESKKLDDLLHELQNQRVHMAIIIDEYGAVAGLVTIEDLVEEIIGDIQDEYDREEQLFERISPNEYIVDAKMNIDDFNELVGVELEAGEEYDSVGGFVLSQIDKIPSVGDVVQTEEVTLTVLMTKGRRITKIKAVLAHSSDDDQGMLLIEPPKHAEGRDLVNNNGRSNGKNPSNHTEELPSEILALPAPESPEPPPVNEATPEADAQEEPLAEGPSDTIPTRPSVPSRPYAHAGRRRTRRR